MKRRKFIQSAGQATLGGLLLGGLGCAPVPRNADDLIIGHNDFRYKVNENWGKQDASKIPVNDCHEMVIDSQGRILLLTNDTRNNVIIYNKDGKVLDTWGHDYPGAHGLTLMNEGGEDMLYIADNNRHEIIKTTIDGEVIMTLPYPAESELYTNANQYVPTETAIAANGDIYVADGYGAQHILHYNAKGELLNVFGGRGDGDAQFQNAHGICIDTRAGNPTLLITARQQNKLKRFTMDGQWIENIDLPGAFICRPVIKGEAVYLATIWSGDGSTDTGMISILNKDNQLVSAPGGCAPAYVDGQLKSVYQQVKVFKHPHDVCVDADDNIYVAQWNAGQVYPFKMERI